jgi:hypothetical protein
MCDFEVTVRLDKSVARIRLVNTKNPSACATVNWRVCAIAIALVCSSELRKCIRHNKSNNQIQNTSIVTNTLYTMLHVCSHLYAYISLRMYA